MEIVDISNQKLGIDNWKYLKPKIGNWKLEIEFEVFDLEDWKLKIFKTGDWKLKIETN